MKRTNSISRTFPFTKSCSFSKIEFKKRFSDIFTSTKTNHHCVIDPLAPSYLVKETIKMKKEMIFIPEINDYMEVEIESNRPIIRTRQELLAFTKTNNDIKDTQNTPNDEEELLEKYEDENYFNSQQYYSHSFLLPELRTRTPSRSSSLISYQSENKMDVLNHNSDTYTLDSYYMDTELSNNSAFYKNVYDKLKNIRKKKFSISSISSIYTQSDACSLISLSSVSSDNSILGKNLLQNSNRNSF